MSGGAYEWMMANYDGTIGGSGFSVMPDSKYYDLYPSSIFTGDDSSNFNFCTLGTCGGHALSETRNWYGEDTYFVGPYNLFNYRGGGVGDGSLAGIFNAYSGYGYDDSSYSFRSVLVSSPST